MLEAANVTADAVDLVVSISLSVDHVACAPEVVGPRLAYPVHKGIGAKNSMVLDLTLCSWSAAIDAAAVLADQMDFSYIVIVRSESTGNSIRPCQYSGFRISDGAGAILLKRDRLGDSDNAVPREPLALRVGNIPGLVLSVDQNVSQDQPYRTQYEYPISDNNLSNVESRIDAQLSRYSKIYDMPSNTRVITDNWFGRVSDAERINGAFNIPEVIKQSLADGVGGSVLLVEYELVSSELTVHNLLLGATP